MKTLFAITHVKDGRRTLTFANQGRNHYETAEAANTAMRDYEPDLRARMGDAAADSLQVRAVQCYDHGDAVGVWFD